MICGVMRVRCVRAVAVIGGHYCTHLLQTCSRKYFHEPLAHSIIYYLFLFIKNTPNVIVIYSLYVIVSRGTKHGTNTVLKPCISFASH
jgi:hypothetical protein